MKQKEQTLTTYFFTALAIIIVAVYLALSFSPITAHAEESTATTYNYTLTLHEVRHNTSGKCAKRYTEYYQNSTIPLAAYLSRDEVASYGGTVKEITVYSSDMNICKLHVSSSEVLENDGVPSFNPLTASTEEFMYNCSHFIRSTVEAPDVYTVSTNIPIFSTYEQMENYLKTGNTDGIINGYDVDLENTELHDPSYNLLGFQCNNQVTATWTGASAPTKVANENLTVREYVKIYAEYETGLEAVTSVPLSDLTFSKAYAELSTTSKPLKSLQFIPIYSQSDGIFGSWLYGNTITVTFDENGNVGKVENQINDFLENMGNKGTLGYLQNVIFKEENNVLSPRTATISWSTTKDIPNARIEIVSENMYGTWSEQFTGMHVYKKYADDVMYSHGSITFESQEPVRTWCKEKGYDITNPLKYRTYLTNYYYVRLVKYDENTKEYNYGGWVRIDINRGNSTQLPWTNTGTGNWNIDTGDWEQDNTSEDSYNYETGSDGTITNPINVDNLEDINLNAFTWMWHNVKAMVATMGDFPLLVTTVFGFLPQQFIVALGALLIAIILMRFLGR